MRANWCRSLISSLLAERNVAPRPACRKYSPKGLNVRNLDTQQANKCLDEGLISVAETLPKFCPQPASKLGKQGQMSARRRNGSKFPGMPKDADHQ